MTIDQANSILEDCGVRNTSDSDRGNYLAYQAINGVVHLCDCNTCTACDGFDSLTYDEIAREAAEWLECTADE